MTQENAIGHTCIMCGKPLSDHERRQIIEMGFQQTWHIACANEHELKQIQAGFTGKIEFKGETYDYPKMKPLQ